MNVQSAARFWLADHLPAEAINLHLGSTHRDAVPGELVDLVPELRHDLAGRQTLLRALQDRESLHSTGIGDGIALPHARNAMAGVVQKPILAFGRHSTGIAFGAIDDQPVRTFILLVATTVTQHLPFLARISRMLRDPRLRQTLLTEDTPARILASLRDTEVRDTEARF